MAPMVLSPDPPATYHKKEFVKIEPVPLDYMTLNKVKEDSTGSQILFRK